MHARAGNRASYAPLSSQLAPTTTGDPGAIARAFRDRLGLRELYLADLDAIVGRAPQRETRRAIIAELPDVSVWVDAGVAGAEQAREILEDGAARVIVGLETFPAAADPRAALGRLAVAIGLVGSGDAAGLSGGADQPDSSDEIAIVPSRRAVFSLDLRHGQPLAADPALRSLHPIAIAELAVECGFGTIIVLDLAHVGMGTGPDLAMLRELRRALPRVELASGGGIRDAADLQRLADAGADAALVGSALHHGSTDHGSILWLCGVSRPDVTSPPADD